MPPMLWRSREAPHVTILGSIHAFDRPLPEWVLKACDEADLMIFEAEPGEEPLPLPNGVTISDLSTTIGQAATQEAALLGYDPQYIDHQFPFRANILLGAQDAMRRFGLQRELGVESTLLPLAKENEPPGFLEQAQDVYMSLFYEPPINEQLLILGQGLTERHSGINPLGRIADAWRACDLDAVWSVVGARLLREQSALYVRMFPRRHAAWIDKAVEWIEWCHTTDRTLLFVLGCLHMAGPDNFLNYLAERGYRFQRLPA